MQTVKPLTTTSHKQLDASQTTNEALKQLDSSKDLVAVTRNGAYEGVVTAEQIFRHEVTNQGQKIRAVYKRAPKIQVDTDVIEALRLMYEEDLKILPVFDDNLHGVIHINDVLPAVLNEDTELTANDIMTPNVTTINPQTSVKQAIGILRQHKISRLPVTEDNTLVGIVSIYDIVHRFHKPQERKEMSKRNQERSGLLSEKHSPLDVDTRSIMKQNLVTASQKTTMPDIIESITDNNVGSVLITSKDNAVKGIITRRDILHRLVHEYQETNKTVAISISSNIDNLGREELTEMIRDFVTKFNAQIGPGYITLHVKRQRQRRKGQSLLYGRLHVQTDQTKQHLTAEGYGPLQLTRNLLRKLRTRILKYHQDHQQVSAAEYFEHFDITSL